MYGKMQESGPDEIIPFISISAIWGQYPVFLLSAHRSEWLQPKGCQIAGTVFLPGCPGGLELLTTVTSLFTDMAGNTPSEPEGNEVFFFFLKQWTLWGVV